MPQKAGITFKVKIDKLVHGGQGIGVLESGQKALVWGVLPGEEVRFMATKKRSDYVEGIAQEIITASPDRIVPKDDLYLSTSPWQIMAPGVEDRYKSEILKETIERAKVDYNGELSFRTSENFWQYRGKMEYSFYGDETGLHLALFNRGTHQKEIVTGSSIARSEVDKVAQNVCSVLNKNSVRAGDLKTIIVRCNQDGEVVAALFTRDKYFPKIEALNGLCNGIAVVYSNPKSPASVRTKDLYSYGDISLTEYILDRPISYDVFSFFQVNIPVFEKALSDIELAVGSAPVIDMYSGVGTIGLSLPSATLLVESDAANIEWTHKNASSADVKVTHLPSEKALDYIDSHHTIIIDPPRAGLHNDLIDRIREVKPPKIIYLSCNPSTQMRDVARLQNNYDVDTIIGYNFFPRTPHIEALAVLLRKEQ